MHRVTGMAGFVSDFPSRNVDLLQSPVSFEVSIGMALSTSANLAISLFTNSGPTAVFQPYEEMGSWVKIQLTVNSEARGTFHSM